MGSLLNGQTDCEWVTSFMLINLDQICLLDNFFIAVHISLNGI